MSIQAMAWVLQFSRAEGYQRLVLLAIANHASFDGTNAKPSIDTIAEEARVGRSTVCRALPKLVDLGELEITHGGAGPRSTNQYRVRMEGSQSGTLKGSQSGTLSPQKGSQGPPKKGPACEPQTVIPRTELHAGAREALPVGALLRNVAELKATLAGKAGVR